MNQKRFAAAYILWLFLAGLRAHGFYLGRIGSAVVLLLLSLSAVFLAFRPIINLVAFVPVVLILMWLFVDAFLITGMARSV